MKHPCMARCEVTNRMVIRDEVREVGGAPERGGGGEKGKVLLVNNHLWSDCSNDESSDFYHPPDLDRSKLIFLLISG